VPWKSQPTSADWRHNGGSGGFVGAETRFRYWVARSAQELRRALSRRHGWRSFCSRVKAPRWAPKRDCRKVPPWMKGTPSFARSATLPPTNGIHAVRGEGAAPRCGSLPELRAAGQRLFPVVPMLLVTKQHGGCNDAALGVVPETVLRGLGSGTRSGHIRGVSKNAPTTKPPLRRGPCQWAGQDSNLRPTDYESAALTS
jgi:hypothetical protein